MLVAAISPGVEAAVARVGFRHGLPDQSGVGQDLRLPPIRLEWFPFPQAERSQHRMEENVVQFDWHIVEPLPVFHSARQQSGPCFRARVEYFCFLQVVMLRPGIYLQPG